MRKFYAKRISFKVNSKGSEIWGNSIEAEMDNCKAFCDRGVWTAISEEFSAISLKHT